MQLDKIIIALRTRSPWEAMDLGIILMRYLWPVIFVPWLLLASFVTFLVVFFQLQEYWYIPALVFWWLKPLYDSLILYVISRAVFGERMNTLQVFYSAKNWIKTGLLSSLLFWRFSLSRAFDMPVHLLEGLSGERRRKRLHILHRVTGSHTTGLTIIALHFEYLLLITIYMSLAYIAPESMMEYFNIFSEDESATMLWTITASLIYSLVVFILEPFYVASGFMLYLNRRTQLEGWDIELDFKNLAARIDNRYNLIHGISQNKKANVDA